jgi:hypothetical protein
LAKIQTADISPSDSNDLQDCTPNAHPLRAFGLLDLFFFLAIKRGWGFQTPISIGTVRVGNLFDDTASEEQVSAPMQRTH